LRLSSKNASAKLLAQVAFAPPMAGPAKFSRIFGVKTTRASASASALKQFCHPALTLKISAGFPKILELLCLKTPFARSLSEAFLKKIFTFSAWLRLISRGILKILAGTVPAAGPLL